MKKLIVIAALLTTTAHAHAGNSISFEIDGHKVRIEAPKNCGELGGFFCGGQAWNRVS